MENTKLVINTRELTGTSNAKRLRKSGILPGVVYSDGKEATAIQIDMHAFEELLHHERSESLLIEVSLNGKDIAVFVKDVQHDPVSGDLVHIDLQKVSKNKPIQASVMVEVEGDAEGVKVGGVMDHVLHEIDVVCLPADLPEVIEVDVSTLNIGDAIHVSDLDDKEGKLKFLQEDDSIVVSIASPNLESDDDEENEDSEPEVITEKKVEE